MPGRSHAWSRAGGALLLVAAACGGETAPAPSTGCVADGTMTKVICTIRNEGDRASRACFRARVQPPDGPAIIARRLCSKELQPGQSVEVPALFEPLGRTPPEDLLRARCVKDGRWVCRMDIVETPREMIEDKPKER